MTAQIQAGIGEPPVTTGDSNHRPADVSRVRVLRLKRRVAEGIAENTRKDYLWQLSNHLLPFFGSYLLSEFSERLVDEFKDRKLEERARVLAARDAGISSKTAAATPDGRYRTRRSTSSWSC